MNISYVSRGFDWTEEMKQTVRRQLVEPLRRQLKTSCFELSVHFDGHVNNYEMWAVLQTFDGRGNELVRCQGIDFHGLTEQTAELLLEKVTKAVRRPRYAAQPFQFSPFERTA